MDKKPEDECNTQTKRPRKGGEDEEPSESCQRMDDIIGSFGKYQFMIFMFKILIGVTSAFNNLGVTFFAPSDFVSFWCTDGTTLQATNASISPINLNTTILDYDISGGPTTIVETSLADNYIGNETLDVSPFKEGSPGLPRLFDEFLTGSDRKYKHNLNLSSDTPKNLRKECKYLSPNNNSFHKCSSYEYDTGIWISTIIDEWNLVCNRSWFISVTQSLYMAGFIVSYLTFGPISDRFGRWKSLLLGTLIEILSGFGCAFANSITQFMIFRFLLGIGSAGRSSSSYLIMIEWTGIKWRMHISSLGTLGWIIGYCMMPWIVLYFLHWRHMQLFICFYEIIFLIWLLFLPESPKWLLAHKRFNQAYNVLLMAAKFNGLIVAPSTTDQTGEVKKRLDSSSAGKLVKEEFSSDSVSSNYVTALSQSFSNEISVKGTGASLPGEKIEIAQISSSTLTTSETTRSNGNACYDIGEYVKNVQQVEQKSFEALGGGAQAGETNERFRNYLTNPLKYFTRWFCGEDRASDMEPYTREEFDAKFKCLTNVIEAKEFTKNENKLTIIDLFQWKNLRKYTLIIAFCWAVNSFVYYGIALRVGDFGAKNLFVSFSFAGAMEIPSLFFILVCMKMLPRRTTNLFMFTNIFFLCILQVPIRYYKFQGLQQATMLLAKFFNNCSFMCILYQTMELFPTSIRQTAYSSISIAGRVGSIMAPFMKELSQLTSNRVPPVIYAILSIIQIVLIRYLPETQGVDLPDTLLEAEKFKGVDEKKRWKGKENLDEEKAHESLDAAEKGGKI